jgi:ketosteroid isomerase-like protein
MKPIVFAASLLFLTTSVVSAASTDSDELTRMLHQFLAGASREDAEAHDRFWADDLIYTSSAGLRLGKADIMSRLGAAASDAAEEPATVYSAEDIRIQQYGDTAVVAFRLLGTPGDEAQAVMQYFNTGTFLRRDGKWRVVAWQATRIPEQEL